MTTRTSNLNGAIWRKSSYSGNNESQCVEIAVNIPDLIPVRDSKDKEGPALTFNTEAFSTFIQRVKAGRLDG
ncbi:DUF397 domain-containing protein [Streptomyces noursei]|uniref:DUF397 domain-containing protein n=1 Tax=Streptomyces noursei TaxID=1971 RepID=UPI00344F0DBB